MPDIIGIDIGGTKCTLAKADMNGQIMSEPIQFATTNVHATLAEIYAIVDSLTALKTVNRVQITIGGTADVPFHSISLSEPLDRNESYILPGR